MHNDSARVALRTLASPARQTIKEEVDYNDGRMASDDGQPKALSSMPESFFERGTSMQITDSPATSPTLGPQRSPLQSFHESYGTGQSGSGGHYADTVNRSRAHMRMASRRRNGSSDTPLTSEVPSLSLSNSSASDSYLLSPYHEGLPPSVSSQGTSSMSSVRTIQPSSAATYPHQSSHTHHRRSSRDMKRLDAIHRAAAMLRMPIEEVQHAMDLQERLRERYSHSSHDPSIDEHDDLQNVDRDAIQRICETVQAEEDRLTQIASFRAAYMHAESMRSDLELHPHPQQPPMSPSQQRSPSSSSLSNHPSYAPSQRRLNREGIIGMPSASRTMPPISPPPTYDQLEMMEHLDPRHDGSVIPSPRAALESLTGRHSYGAAGPHDSQFSSLHNQRYPSSSSANHNQFPPVTQHVRRVSGSRPISLPDRSYRSMDDYVGDPFAASVRNSGGSTSGFLRRSVQAAPYPTRPSLSRTASRSPLFAESPRLTGVDASNELGGGAEGPGSSPLLSTSTSSYHHHSHRLQPGTGGPQRTRSGSTTSNRSSLSRRASGDLLGLGIPRSISPSIFDTTSIRSSSGGAKMSHEEVMARLQRKVKERIAAREAANGNSGGDPNGLVSASTPASPSVALSSLSNMSVSGGGGGRRRQGSASGLGPNAPSSAQRSSSRSRKPRKSHSLKTLPRSNGAMLDEKPLPPLPTSSTALPHPAGKADGVTASPVKDEPGDDQMSGVEQEPAERGPHGELRGIEALLSAAAIADSPRIN